MNTLRKALLALVKLYGIHILNDPRRCKAYLMDCCGKQRREIFAIIAAQEERVPFHLLNASSSVPKELHITQLTAALVNNRPITPQSAREAIEMWAYVLAHVGDIYAIRPPKEDVETTPTAKPKSVPQSPAKPTVKPAASSVAPPSAQIIIRPCDLDFGAITDWTRCGTQSIQVRHEATAVVYGQVQSTLPWLHIVPEGFACRPKQTLTLTVSLTAAVTRLSPKAYTIPDAIVVKSQAQRYPISVRIDIRQAQSARSYNHNHPTPTVMAVPAPTSSIPAQPAHTLPPLHLDFGTVSSRAASLPEQVLRLPNAHPTHILTGTVRSTLPWLKITPGGFVCPPGQQVHLTAQVTTAIRRLRPKMYQVPDGVVIEIEGHRYPVNVQVEVRR